ncbi:MAG: hypothetical protein IPM74_05430 [Crocinitomicaceae bacterium]|nr:hypothetical protein [Crocinitomicaceae bacterium]MBK8925345.1 hypothetical protein [Crocinitomicaceae bacterium]
MKKMFFAGLALVALGLTSCSGEIKYKTDKNSGFYEIDIPEHMEITSELNDEASTQYEWVSAEGSVTKEHYVIVLMETKEEIASYGLEGMFDALSYSELSVESIGSGLIEYNILTKAPKIEKINGMDCVRYQMDGSNGVVGVYYELGVFEGEKAFYQVLTWTIKDQKDEFKPQMDHIINSFKETK